MIKIYPRRYLNLHPVFKIGELSFYIFPLILLLAVFLCALVYILSPKYEKSYAKVFGKSIIFVLVFVILIGRLFSAITLIQSSERSFIHNLIYGGFVFYGGLIGGAIGGYVFCKIYHVSYLNLLDIYLTIIPIGQAVGRIGCYLNGCCYGTEYNGLFSVPYLIDGINISVFPTWFFESIYCFLLAIFFHLIFITQTRGIYTVIYLIAYSAFRFFIEFFRGDDLRGKYGWISTSQIISIIIFICGLLIAIYSMKNKQINQMINKG